jgi:uroporphyrin-III C-methyltransferase
MNHPRVEQPEAGADEQPATSPAEATAEAEARSDREAVTEKAVRPHASTRRSMGIVLGMFALLVAFAAAGGALLTWWKVAEQQDAAAEAAAELRRQVADADSRVAAHERRLTELHRDVEERRATMEGLDSQLRQARARLDALTREEAGPERTPGIAEVEFLLLLANRELSLGDNPKVALTALREADRRLARMDEPELSAVRQAIHDEIAAVEAVTTIDLDGIALRLGSLAGRVEGLPLRASLSPVPDDALPEQPDSGWARLRARLRSLAEGIFRIRRNDAPAAPLLAPHESFFLYRNVELDLKSARLAVLTRDRINYAGSLESARETLNAYFETSDPAVQSLLGALEELDGRDIAPEWPDIGRSLDLLRLAGASD